jgi:hypothetical protein
MWLLHRRRQHKSAGQRPHLGGVAGGVAGGTAAINAQRHVWGAIPNDIAPAPDVHRKGAIYERSPWL